VEAPASTKLDAALQELSVLVSSDRSFPRQADPVEARGVCVAVLLPMLTHLSISPSYSLISDFSVLLSAPNLTSLQIVLDSQDLRINEALTWVDSPSFTYKLRKLTIRMVGTYVRKDILLRCIGEVTRHIDLLPSPIIKDFTASVFESVHGVDRLPGEGRFHELVFENVKYVLFYYYGNGEGDMNDPVDPDNRLVAFVRLCERADLVRLRNGLEEKMIKRSEWSI
jgi:hypothetical protein